MTQKMNGNDQRLGQAVRAHLRAPEAVRTHLRASEKMPPRYLPLCHLMLLFISREHNQRNGMELHQSNGEMRYTRNGEALEYDLNVATILLEMKPNEWFCISPQIMNEMQTWFPLKR